MEGFVIPQILDAGIFDASIAHKGLAVTQPRTIDRYQIEIPIENGGTFHIDGRSVPVTTDLIVCTKPGQVRYTHFPLRCLYVHIAPEPGPVCDYLNALPDVLKPEDLAYFYQLLSDIAISYLFPKEANDLFIAGRLLRMIHRLYTEVHEPHKDNQVDHPLLLRALSYMNANYLEHITIADVASHINVSKIHLQRLFSDMLNITPYRYLMEKRLNKSKELLLTTTLSLNEIAEITGFSSQSHFGVAFKKETSKTPLQYRKEILRIHN
jgi:AraC-like DNA-binding protein